MRIIPVKDSSPFYKNVPYNEIITEFINSDYEVVEVTDYNSKEAYVCVNNCNIAIKRMKISGIKAVTRNKRAYLIKEKK